MADDKRKTGRGRSTADIDAEVAAIVGAMDPAAFDKYLLGRLRDLDGMMEYATDKIDEILKRQELMMEAQRRQAEKPYDKASVMRGLVRFAGLLMLTNFFWAAEVRRLWLPNIDNYWPLVSIAGAIIYGLTFILWTNGHGDGEK